MRRSQREPTLGHIDVEGDRVPAPCSFNGNVLPTGTYTFGATLGSVTLNATFTRQ